MTPTAGTHPRKAAPVANRPPARARHPRHRHGNMRLAMGYRGKLLAQYAAGRVMEWSRLYASLTDNPRVQAAEDDGGAGWLLIQSFCYCTSAESGGFIPKTQVPRFGGPRLRQRVAALAREKLWIAAEGGYLLDPEIWSEERNLSDSAEKKRQADRERIAAKRAAERAARSDMSRDMSRDSRTAGRATPTKGEEMAKTLPPPDGIPAGNRPSPDGQKSVDIPTARGNGSSSPGKSRDSRTVEKIRSDLSVVDVGNQSSDRNARARDDDRLLVETVTDAMSVCTGHDITAVRAGEIAASIIGNRRVTDPVAYIREAICNEPDPVRRWLADVYIQSPLTGVVEEHRPPWCGKCSDPLRRQVDRPGDSVASDTVARCPDCHPASRKETA